VHAALEEGVASCTGADLVERAEEARNDAIQVDSFSLAEYVKSSANPDQAGSMEPKPGDGSMTLAS
jgi:hypothetical protein